MKTLREMMDLIIENSGWDEEPFRQKILDNKGEIIISTFKDEQGNIQSIMRYLTSPSYDNDCLYGIRVKGGVLYEYDFRTHPSGMRIGRYESYDKTKDKFLSGVNKMLHLI
jgi:hypothetical protein